MSDCFIRFTDSRWRQKNINVMYNIIIVYLMFNSMFFSYFGHRTYFDRENQCKRLNICKPRQIQIIVVWWMFTVVFINNNMYKCIWCFLANSKCTEHNINSKTVTKILILITLERFSIEAITTSYVNNPMKQWEPRANTCHWHQAREDACDQVAIGFCFVSDWLRSWCKFF